MNEPKSRPRFQINPVEIGILTAFFFVFSVSLYQLVTDWKSNTTLVQNFSRDSERKVSSVAANDLSLNCEEQQDLATGVDQVRLIGKACEAPVVKNQDSNTYEKTEVIREDTEAVVAVFQDKDKKQFATEHLLLNKGENVFLIRHVYAKGTVESSLTITKTSDHK